MGRLTVGAGFAFNQDQVWSDFATGQIVERTGATYRVRPNIFTEDVLVGSFSYGPDGSLGGQATALERRVDGNLAFRIEFPALAADTVLRWIREAPNNIYGADWANTLQGGGLGDRLHGAGGPDLLLGGGGADTLSGGALDQFVGGAGDDRISGAADYASLAIYSGRQQDYALNPSTDGYVRITDTRPNAPEGSDLLRHVTVLKFADTTALFQASEAQRNAFQAAANILRLEPAALFDAPAGAVVAHVSASMTPTVIQGLVRAADATTSVATLAYQFFTGKIPGLGGIDYLVSPTGPNPNNLNSAYYQSFNLENRYINFAVNLGREGEGKAQFQAEYGGLTLAQATKLAYDEIFGTAPSDAKVAALLSGGRDLYFEAYGQDGPNGLGTKAAMVGWLLAEAEKADIGQYARSNAAFLTDLADGASFAVDLIGTYGKAEYDYAG